MRWLRALNVEDIQDGTLGCRLARAPGYGLCQQPFKLSQGAELGSNVFEMVRSNFADFAARCPFQTAEPQHGADLSEREAQLAPTTNEGQDANVRRAIDAAATRRAWRLRKHIDPLVITDRLDIHAA
jgi:hypothetical protein